MRGRITLILTQHVSNPPEQNPPDSGDERNVQQPPKPPGPVFSKRRLIPFLALLGILIILSSSLFVQTFLQPPPLTATATFAVSSTATVPAKGTLPRGQRPTATPTPAASPT